MIFLSQPSLDQLNLTSQNTMVSHLGIEFSGIGDDYIEATMPVDHRTKQPMGLLHGGANVVLAETLGSIASSLTLETEKYACVGLEINANHLRSVKSGVVTGKAMPIRLGRSAQVWGVEIRNEDGHLVAVSRMTLAVIPNS